MTDDTTAAMDHLRESCAIAAGRVPPPPPYRPDTHPLKWAGGAQVTCWQTGEWAECVGCGWDVIVVTDGRREWATCPECGDITAFAA